MKIRTDFVTNSSSSSFTVNLRARFADGVSARFGSEEWSGDGNSQSISFAAKTADGAPLCSGYCSVSDDDCESMEDCSMSVQSISLAGLADQKSASSLADALKNPFGLGSHMEADEDEGVSEELAQKFNAMADACDAVLMEHLKSPADLKRLSLALQFSGRGDLLAEYTEIVKRMFDWKQGDAVEQALDDGADVAALRKLPFLARYTDEALQNMIDFWNECDCAPGNCEIKQTLTKDGMVDMTFTWGEEELFDFDDEDSGEDDGPEVELPAGEEDAPDKDMTVPADESGQCEEEPQEKVEQRSDAPEEKADAGEEQTEERADAAEPAPVSEVKPESIPAPMGVENIGDPTGPGFKIIHTSDWHFGMRVATGNYQDCQGHFLEQLYDLIRRENVGAVVCAGDIYDSGNVGADAIALFDRAAQTICGELGVPLIVIAGNHDSPERLAAHRELLSGAGLHIFGRLERDIQPVLLDGGKVAVYPVPFFNRYEVKALFPGQRDNIHSLQDAHKVVLDHIRETMDPSRRNIVVSHAYIVGAALSESDRAAMKGLAPAASYDVFQGFDYVALGHIHGPQQVGPNACYSGSPVKYSFSEENQEKGVVLINTEDMSRAFVTLPLLRDRKTVRGTFAELMARTDLADHYLRLRVTDRYSGLETYAELKDRFPFLLELTGMRATGDEKESSLTMEELETLSDEDVLKKFLAERFDYTPTEGQLALFREAMAQVEEE